MFSKVLLVLKVGNRNFAYLEYICMYVYTHILIVLGFSIHSISHKITKDILKNATRKDGPFFLFGPIARAIEMEREILGGIE